MNPTLPELDPLQSEQLITQRARIAFTKEQLKKTIELAKNTKEIVLSQHHNILKELDSMREILTPTQFAKFLIWIKNNPSLMRIVRHAQNFDGFDSSPRSNSQFAL